MSGGTGARIQRLLLRSRFGAVHQFGWSACSGDIVKEEAPTGVSGPSGFRAWCLGFILYKTRSQ